MVRSKCPVTGTTEPQKSYSSLSGRRQLQWQAGIQQQSTQYVHSDIYFLWILLSRTVRWQDRKSRRGDTILRGDSNAFRLLSRDSGSGTCGSAYTTVRVALVGVVPSLCRGGGGMVSSHNLNTKCHSDYRPPTLVQEHKTLVNYAQPLGEYKHGNYSLLLRLDDQCNH